MRKSGLNALLAGIVVIGASAATSALLYSHAAAEAQTGSGLVRGDLNLDGVADLRDVAPFVLALQDPTAWQQAYGAGLNTLLAVADFDGDGQVTVADRIGFLEAIRPAAESALGGARQRNGGRMTREGVGETVSGAQRQ